MHKWLVVCLLIQSHNLIFASHWLEKKAEGWAWYEEVPKKQKKNHSNELQIESATSKIETVQIELKEKLSTAILEPTSSNILNYLILQKTWMERATKFSQNWSRVILDHPYLDQSRVHPTNQIALQIEKQNRSLILDGKLKSLGNTHALLFVFDASDSASKMMASIIEDFAREYHWKVMAVSRDGQGISQFPNPILDKGITKLITQVGTPALCTIDPSTEQVKNIGIGLLTIEQIKENIAKQHHLE